MSVDIAADRAQQARTIAFLERPDSYRHACESVERIDTHGAIVFLAGEHVYKIKRAVRYAYLDFSSIAKRERICRRELVINQPGAPEIYLNVVPITQDADGDLCIDGIGEPVEWAVHMRRFDQSELLKSIIVQTELSAPLCQAIAMEIIGFHCRADRVRTGSAAQRLEAVVNTLSHFFEQQKPLTTLILRFCRNIDEQHRELAPLLNSRGCDGFVVRGHGDLHLSNIAVHDGAPLLFDALEFDEELATVDVLYDLAFLLMDLCVNDRRGTANRIFNRYFFDNQAADNLDGLRALPLFLALRAGVRAMVTIQGSELTDKTGVDEAVSIATSYLNYADKSLTLRLPRLVAIGGLSGTGKSTLASALAPEIGAEPGALHIRSDLERKALWQVSDTTRLPDSAYSADSNRQVYEAVLGKARDALLAGHSVIVDAVFSETVSRRDIEALAHECGAAFSGLWLQASPDEMRRRIRARRNDASDATVDILNKQLAGEIRELMWHQIDADGELSHTVNLACQAFESDNRCH